MDSIMRSEKQLKKELAELEVQRDELIKDMKALSPVHLVSESPEYRVNDIPAETRKKLREAQKNLDDIEAKIKNKRQELRDRESIG